MRTAIVGLGAMGRRHAQAVNRLGWNLAAVCDARPEALVAIRLDAPEAVGFTDLGELLEAVSPEALIVATTAPSHVPISLAALRAGVRHLLVEKPLATSVAACAQLSAAAQDAGACVAVNHPMRFMPIYAEPIAWVRDEALGGFQSLSVVSGAGGLAMIGSHFLEAFRLASGEPVARVRAWLDEDTLPNPRGPQFEDRTGTLLAWTPSGKRFHLEMGAGQGHGIRLNYTARNGQACVDLLGGTLETLQRAPEEAPLPTTRYGTPAARDRRDLGASDPTAASAAILQALINGHPVPSVEDSRNIVATLAAAIASSELGREVDVDGPDVDPEREFPWA